LNGEYGLSTAIFDAGFTVDTPLYKYQNVDWRNPVNNGCNKNQFVGRGGEYEGTSINPFESVFFKRVWPTLCLEMKRKVRFEETWKYMYWRSQWSLGLGGHVDSPPPNVPATPCYNPDMVVE
jgi:hypothetical protein